ncbi:M43 family zinc metalloprotease [Lewinella cohaerens]|uniref:M43 family zinc metalloprotease n=1 Tax=Lewinella cohaerens TaxID=70995 RepID=UPI00037B4DA6|nr:M43 family zinc metalloprotease [Lewinella cohaerens]
MRTVYFTLSGALLLLALTFTTSLSAQRNCGAMEHLQMEMENDSKRALKLQQIEEQTRNFIQNTDARAVNGIITIPVVVHVVYNNSTENISDAQVQSQIDVLNDDFRRTNSDADNTWSQAADTEIEFCLASVDPDGNATNGITRTSTSVTAFSTNDNMKFNSSGGKDAWPAADYLNMWSCDISGGILGYAQFPGGDPATDGVVMDYQYFGTIGTATAPFDLGRTATHEVGHWLNLRHIWGDGNCNVDDFVSDTPTSDAANYGCATGHVSCSTVDMVQNYMDYSDDACMNLYTAGQKTRMRALFEPGGARASLLNSAACGAPPTPTCSDGIQNGNETGVDCGGPDCDACPPCTDVIVSITLDNYPEETSWTITNSGGSVVASGGTYGSQPDGSTVTITNCLPDGCYDFTINDAYGDGICCSYGNGSYSVTTGGSTVASGGSFGSSETTNFCVGGGPAPTCTDGIQNGNETGVDCGGPDCAACPTCDDGIQNGNETGVDCGGPDCAACPTCDDGIQNGSETGVDCGGPDCAACPTCDDGIQNGNETGVDCGGPDCAACPVAPTCTDGIQNGNETGIDCGGPDCPACPVDPTCTDVIVSITLDNYPEETSWTITDNGGSVVASGGTYGNQADGSTVNITVCLVDGCYDFTINDTYGDGICCSYGNGSYSVTIDGNKVASGDSFGSSETTNFCIGGSPAPTCTDGIQNGSETGVDCGGPDCAPCNTGGCTDTNVNFNNFESGWGIWNDGGSDCRRSANDAAYSNGSYSIRLRDNTSTSVMTTDNLNLAGFEEVTIDFSYYPRSMETGEDFWLQASTDGGSSYQTLASWASGTDFSNNVRENETIVITGTFTSTTRFRFRCDASGNSDYIYIDDVDVSGCANGARMSGEELLATPEVTNNEPSFSQIALFPNPTSSVLNVDFVFDQSFDAQVQVYVTDMTGKALQQLQWTATNGKQRQTLDVSQFAPGIYMLHLISGEERVTQRFVVAK